MNNKGSKLTVSMAVIATALLGVQPQIARAQIGISALQAPDGSPSPALSVSNDGNVGINTANPYYHLQVNGILGLEAGFGSSPYSLFSLRANPTDGVLFSAPQDSSGNKMAYRFGWSGGGADALTILGNRNVGVNTAAPYYHFQVNGVLGIETGLGNSPYSLFSLRANPTDGVLFSAPRDSSGNNMAYHFGWSVSGSDALTILGDGSVGIGNQSPQARLDVNGQVRCTTLLLTSDRQAKGEFQFVDKRALLEKVVSLPLSTWHYTNAPGVRHLGPMAQDFKAAFPDLGEDDKHIATVDADGVALASIQALYEMVQDKDSEIASLKRQISSLKTELAVVKDGIVDRLAKLEGAMSKNVQQASFRLEAGR